LHSRIGRDLQNGERNRHNVIIRPRADRALLIQLDDFGHDKAAQIEPYAFMTLCTSPGNYQFWLAVSDGPKESEKEAAKEFRRRVRRGAGSDKYATGATRVAGSLNFKTKYAPEFPRVEITQTNVGKITGVAALELAGLVAPREEPQPPRLAYTRPMTASGRPSRKKWPSYQMCLDGAPESKSRPGTPRRSLADFTWCRTAYEWGWNIEAIASRLMEVSTKAQENGESYAILTATRAAESAERQPYRAQSPPAPRQ
jgi:hypothetical protein